MRRVRLWLSCAVVALGLLAIALPAWAQDPATPSVPVTPSHSTAASSAAAHANGHGANTTGPYDPTTTGASADNGNGGGRAVGKPCAGCVGNADAKNPPGQLPNGSDPNAGYECDRNHGVGQGNPAHTSCQVASSSDSPTASELAPVVAASSTFRVSPAMATDPPHHADAGTLSSTGARISLLTLAALVLVGLGSALSYAARRQYFGLHRS
ncbi:MAG TPA: hypothetical protein VE442_10090 [Jatrophihabitans sp.]|jgi:hypothetical protein|nr:hypothetical protein [Jatrophihabitans sp.]